MSPEPLYPDKFRAKDSQPTTQSDCYALGMVVYEVRDTHSRLSLPGYLPRSAVLGYPGGLRGDGGGPQRCAAEKTG